MYPTVNQHHVNIPSPSSTQSTQPLKLNLPCQDLLADGRREEYNKICVPLYQASMEGDWKAAKDILDKNKKLIRCSINGNNETTLHVAVSRRKNRFVKNLMSWIEEEDLALEVLALEDNNSYTAFSIAVTAGDIQMAKILVRKNKSLCDIPTSQGMIPIQMAASFGRQDMMNFLYDSHNMRSNPWTSETRNCFLLVCLEADCFDVALKVLNDHPELISNRGKMLRVLAQKPKAFKPKPPSGIKSVLRCVPQVLRTLDWDGCPAWKLLSIIFKSIAKTPLTEIYDIMRGPAEPNTPTGGKTKYPERVLYLAAEVGNIVFIYEIIRRYPELLREVNDNNQSIFHVAVSCRHENVVSLLLDEVGSTKDQILTLEDNNGNNMLHLAGILTERAKEEKSFICIPGAARKLRRELLFYKDVQSMLPLSFSDKRNVDGFTPGQEFTKHHKNLVYEGEKMMKETGTQLMVVAALLATISFAATITFAGGYNQDKGYPVLRKSALFKYYYMAFICISFLSASASILSILSFLSSRYAEHDFLTSLPRKWSICVSLVYVSILSMVGAFGCNVGLVFEETLEVLSLILECMAMLIICLSLIPMEDLSVPFRMGAILRFDRRTMPSYRA